MAGSETHKGALSTWGTSALRAGPPVSGNAPSRLVVRARVFTSIVSRGEGESFEDDPGEPAALIAEQSGDAAR